MSFYITAESFGLAAAVASLEIDAAAAPSVKAALGPARGTDGQAKLVVVEGFATLPRLGGAHALMIVADDAGDTFQLPPSALAALAGAFAGAPTLMRTGRLLVAKSARQYLLVARDGEQTQRFAALLSSYDPKHRPHLVQAHVDLAQPWHGANVYPNEPSRGYYMRWQGPDPVMRLAIEEPLRRLMRAGPPLVRLEITVALIYNAPAFPLLSLHLGTRALPFLITSASGLTRIITILNREWVEAAIAAEGAAELVATLPMALREMPQGKDGGGRTMTFALSAIELTGFYTRKHLPSFAAQAPQEAVDRIAGALRTLHGTMADGGDGLAALFSEIGEGPGRRGGDGDGDDRQGGREGQRGQRATALNALVDGVFFHRLSLRAEGGERYLLTVERPSRATTEAGVAYLKRQPPDEIEARVEDGTLRLPPELDAATRSAAEALLGRLR